MASVKRVTHKNGRVVYRIVICMGYDKQGGKLVKNLTYSVNQSATPRRQEREALKYAMDLEDRLKYGHVTEVGEALFGEFAGRWLEETKESIAYGTYEGYSRLLESGILPYFKGYKLAHVRTADIEAFYRTLADRYSAGTIRRYANVLSCIFKTAKRLNMIETNPCQCARKPKKTPGSEEIRYFTPRQALMFLKSLDMAYSTPEHMESEVDAASPRQPYTVPTQYRVFYTLSLFCGFRKGETLALRWDDIDFDRREIFVSKSIGRTEDGFGCKNPKNASSVRRVPFPDTVLTLLERYREEYESFSRSCGELWQGDGNLFIQRNGRRMGVTTTYQYFLRHLGRYNRWVRDYPAEAAGEGLEELPLIPLHGLRHSCATLLNYLDVNIIDISKYLGHANCSTTMNIYAHSFEAQKRAACGKLDEFIRKNMKPAAGEKEI